jgi:hypothetical protein
MLQPADTLKLETESGYDDPIYGTIYYSETEPINPLIIEDEFEDDDGDGDGDGEEDEEELLPGVLLPGTQDIAEA